MRPIWLITQTLEHTADGPTGVVLSLHTTETEAWLAFRAAENRDVEADTYLIVVEPPLWRVVAYGGPNQ